MTGKIWSLTINRSTILDSMGVTDIGRKSPNSVTGIHFGTGVIIAVHQADGTAPDPTDILASFVTTRANSLAQSLYTQYGILLIPGEVRLTLDRIISIASQV